MNQYTLDVVKTVGDHIERADIKIAMLLAKANVEIQKIIPITSDRDLMFYIFIMEEIDSEVFFEKIAQICETDDFLKSFALGIDIFCRQRYYDPRPHPKDMWSGREYADSRNIPLEQMYRIRYEEEADYTTEEGKKSYSFYERISSREGDAGRIIYTGNGEFYSFKGF